VPEHEGGRGSLDSHINNTLSTKLANRYVYILNFLNRRNNIQQCIVGREMLTESKVKAVIIEITVADK
jgi:hypothetical protein